MRFQQAGRNPEAPAGQDYFKQSNTRLDFIADRVVDMTMDIFRLEPVKPWNCFATFPPYFPFTPRRVVRIRLSASSSRNASSGQSDTDDTRQSQPGVSTASKVTCGSETNPKLFCTIQKLLPGVNRKLFGISPDSEAISLDSGSYFAQL